VDGFNNCISDIESRSKSGKNSENGKSKQLYISPQVYEENNYFQVLKTQVVQQKNKENSRFFTKIPFGREAKKAIINEDIAVSNQLLRQKRKTLIKLF
jgi:hypothetical protein